MAGGLAALQRGTYSDRGDRNRWVYWDAVTLDHVTKEFRMFQTPWSGAKTRDLTNMKTSGVIPANQRMKVSAITVQYLAAAARTTLVKVYKLLAETVCEIIINGKDASYQRTLLEMMGLVFAVENATGAANVVNQLAFCQVARGDKLMPEVVLAANVPFEVKLTCTNASDASLDGDILKIGLIGDLIRAM